MKHRPVLTAVLALALVAAQGASAGHGHGHGHGNGHRHGHGSKAVFVQTNEPTGNQIAVLPPPASPRG